MIIVDILTENPSARYAPCAKVATLLVANQIGGAPVASLDLFSSEEVHSHLPMAEAFAEIEQRWMA